mmetsp:Transcript_39040/g.58655  ORF Transcript_39040/g.58655 Transcript_39040/m.58655 type:complete len:96 (+) Transcript_39040:322-609(+)
MMSAGIIWAIAKTKATVEPTHPATSMLVMVAGTPNRMHAKRARSTRQETTHPAANPPRTEPEHTEDATTADIITVLPCPGAYDVAATTQHTVGKA